jgi:hypothetical protein
MKKLNEEQVNFLVETFFKPSKEKEITIDWRKMSILLVKEGRCIIPSDKIVWFGGIANFLNFKEADSLIGCIEVNFDVDEFCSKENIFFYEVYQRKLEELSEKIHQLEKESCSLFELI